MDSTRQLSPAADWFAWPLQFAQLAANAFQAMPSARIAPDYLAQAINPGWTFNVNSNNSSAPETEQSVVMRHSYGRQLGRLMDAVDLLVEDLETRQPALAGNEALGDFRRLKADVDDIKARTAERRVERIGAELEALSRSNPPAYRNLKERLRELVRD